MGILLLSSVQASLYTADLAETTPYTEGVATNQGYLTSLAETTNLAESVASGSVFSTTLLEVLAISESVAGVGPPTLTYPLERYSASFVSSNEAESSCATCAGIAYGTRTTFTLSVVQGEDVTIEGTVTLNNSPCSLSGAQIFFTAKKSWRDVDPLILKRTVNAGGTVGEVALLPQLGVTLGKFRIFLTPTDTDGLTSVEIDGATWDWDCWLVTVDGRRETLVQCQHLVLFPRVTVVP